MAEKSTGDKLLYCSFCGKSQHEVRKLIAGPSVFICDECIELCNDIIREEGTTAESARADKNKLPTPHEIRQILDQYVIGQDLAKKILSVAVYNHYKRLETGGKDDGLEKIVRHRTAKTGIGFGAEVSSPDDRKNISVLLREAEPEDLIKFGLIPEFVGRLPVVATLEELDEAALIQILVEPKNALIKQYQKMFRMENVELEIREGALRAIASKALARKTGARGLRSILEQVLLDVMYDLPSHSNLARVVVDEATIANDGKPLLMFAEPPKVASAHS